MYVQTKVLFSNRYGDRTEPPGHVPPGHLPKERNYINVHERTAVVLEQISGQDSPGHQTNSREDYINVHG